MSKIDLSTLTYAELLQLRLDLQRHLRARKANRKRLTREKFEITRKAHSMTFEELLGSWASRRQVAPCGVLFSGENGDDTSGRARIARQRRPMWGARGEGR